MPANIGLDEVVSTLDKLTATEKLAKGHTEFHNTGGFVFCLYSQHANEIWRVGDCQYWNAGEGKRVSFKAEEICAAARSLILQSRLNDGASHTEIMGAQDYDQLIDDLLKHEASFLNRPADPLGIGAVIGGGIPSEYIERIAATLGKLTITSDGYPKIAGDLRETEATLAELLADDPLCIGPNRQCKGLGPNRVSFDDRTYISAELAPAEYA